MFERVFEMLRRLAPPSMDENGDVTDDAYRVQRYEARGRQWRWTVFYMLIVLFVLATGQIVLAWGFTPVFSGFTPREESRAEIAALKGTVSRIEVRQLEQNLLDTRARQCGATDKRFFTDRLNELLGQYYELTRRNWRVPDCDEVKQ